jgi:hypothetical protein
MLVRFPNVLQLRRTNVHLSVKELAYPLPLKTIVQVLGLEAEDETKLKNWADIIEQWYSQHVTYSDPMTCLLSNVQVWWERIA